MKTLEPVSIPKRPRDLPGMKKAAKRVRAGKCPWCGGEVEGGPVEVDGGSCRQPVTCNECPKEWTEHYDLAAVTFYEAGRGQWTDELPPEGR